MNKNIKGVEEKSGAKGTYLKVTWSDGKADNVFKKEHQDVIKVAQKDNLTVDVTKEKQGDYWNVTKVELPSPFAEKPKVELPSPFAEKPKVETPVQNPPAQEPAGDSKARGIALSYAIELVVAGKLEPSHIYQAADNYVVYMTTGKHSDKKD